MLIQVQEALASLSLLITVLIKNVRWFLLKSSEKFIRIFKVVLLFSCQRSFLWSASCVQEALLFYHSSFYLSRTFLIYFVVLNSFVLQQLLYHIISDLVCQELFNDIYFTLFWSFSVSNFYRLSHLITYVKKFFHSFQSQNRIWCYIFPPLFQRRWLSYHSCIQYVNSFFMFFRQLFLPSIYCVFLYQSYNIWMAFFIL